MKRGKKPTVTQKKLLQAVGLDWRAWLVVVNMPRVLVVKHRITGETRVLDKDGQSEGARNKTGKGVPA